MTQVQKEMTYAPPIHKAGASSVAELLRLAALFSRAEVASSEIPNLRIFLSVLRVCTLPRLCEIFFFYFLLQFLLVARHVFLPCSRQLRDTSPFFSRDHLTNTRGNLDGHVLLKACLVRSRSQYLLSNDTRPVPSLLYGRRHAFETRHDLVILKSAKRKFEIR